MMKIFSDQQITSSWKKNVQPWTTAVRQGQIESRALVTDRAVVDTVLDRKPTTALDIGCGEGWLVRTLCDHGIDALGVDVVPEFIDIACQGEQGRFRTLGYEDISFTSLNEKFDLVISNFSLLGKDSVEQLFQHIPSLLNTKAAFIIQTLHPQTSCGDMPYEDGWRQGSWDGFSEDFVEPAPWYFRTLDSWQTLFHDNGFTLVNIQEPVNPKTNTPASIIFIAEFNG